MLKTPEKTPVKTLVVGANGTVGTELVRLLKKEGQTVLRATSKKETAPDQVHLNLLTGEGLDQISHVDQLFLLSPPGHVNQDQLLSPLVEKAKQAKLKKVVLMTAMGVNANPDAPFRKVEILLEKSGLPYNIIRPNWFMQNFNTYWLSGIQQLDQILLPVENAKGSFIDARDIAAVAARLLSDDRFVNQDFDLTGGEALDHDQVAAHLSRVSKRKISFRNISSEEMLRGLLAAGLPKNYSEFMLTILEFFRLGYSARITDSVEKITGQKPTRFETYAQDHHSAWQK